jgi:Fe-Mn family superoxide dismutase
MITRRTLLELAVFGAAGVAAEPPFSLPKLPYSYDALEPYIDALTMQIHHDKHHQAYVDNLNKAVASEPSLAGVSVEDLLRRLDTLPPVVRNAIRNQGGGHANHSLFWMTLTPASKSGKASGQLAKFVEKLQAAALAQFGSGWAWLSLDEQKNLVLDSAPNQDSPLTTKRQPLFGVDVWEHAYYLKYQNRRADYLKAIINVINWDYISQRFSDLAR